MRDLDCYKQQQQQKQGNFIIKIKISALLFVSRCEKVTTS